MREARTSPDNHRVWGVATTCVQFQPGPCVGAVTSGRGPFDQRLHGGGFFDRPQKRHRDLFGLAEVLRKSADPIDIHGVNAYGGAQSLPERYRAAGGKKPYVITEFGPPGAWETETTEWGAPLEMTSSEKAAFYEQTYSKAVLGAPGLALGAFAFTWGHKMEATATWFGMFLSDGSRLASIDAMTRLWRGENPENRAPHTEPLQVERSNVVDPGERVVVNAAISDPDGDSLEVRWALRPESGEYVTGGDFRPNQPDIDGAGDRHRGGGQAHDESVLDEVVDREGNQDEKDDR